MWKILLLYKDGGKNNNYSTDEIWAYLSNNTDSPVQIMGCSYSDSFEFEVQYFYGIWQIGSIIIRLLIELID